MRVTALKQLIGDATLKEFAEAHDLDSSYLSQILNGHRNLGEKAARNMEEKIGCIPGTLVAPFGVVGAAVEAARELMSNVSGEPMPVKTGSVPVVGKAMLGTAGYFEAIDYPVGHGEGFLNIFSSDPNAYGLRVVGNSMNPRIKNNEFVLIEPNREYVAGDEVLVKTTKGQAMIKEFIYYRDGQYRFDSVNADYDPIFIHEDEVEDVQYVGAIVKSSRFTPAS